MTIPLQQTKQWQSLQTSLGEKTFFVENNSYTIFAIKKQSRFGSYLYLPYGPYLHDISALEATYKAIEDLASRENAIFIRIEPQQPETREFWQNLKNSKKTKDLNPAETWCLDLTAEKSEILHNFSQGTRTRYNTFAKKGLAVETSKDPADIKYLVSLQNTLAHARGIATFSENYLKAELSQPFSTLYLVRYKKSLDENRKNLEKSEKNAKNPQLSTKTLEDSKKSNKNSSASPEIPKKSYPADGEIIAASLFFDHFPEKSEKNQKKSATDAKTTENSTRYYMQSAASLKYKNLPATVALLSSAIFDAKNLGIKTFDFWGIAPKDADSSHPWYGFTKFKKSFGGYEKSYCGTFDLIFQPKKYRLYTLARTLNRKIRKLLKK